MKHLKKLSEETLHQNPWWQLKHDVFEKPSGGPADYFYAETNGMSMVIPVLSDGRIILVVQYRYLFDKPSIEFPGGGIKEGSDSLKTAQEELYQETGWVGAEYNKIAKFEPANGYVKDEAHVYITHAVDQHEARPDETEDIELIYRRPDEIEEMIKRNDIWDGMSVAAWCYARHMFFKELYPEEIPVIQSILKNFFDTDK
ncbi:MAG: NUDIX hydrolase [Candidatus Magasanikbacteria bacterium]